MTGHKRHQAKRKTITMAKAREILHHGEVRGHRLTEKQRRFMGVKASGQPVKRAKRKAR